MSGAAKKPLFDKRKVALTKARLRAWWQGAEFDAEAAAAQIDAELAANDTGPADDELFDEPEHEPPPRILALAKLWGEGRLRPGDDSADALEPARIGIQPEGVLAVWGPGLVGPVAAVAAVHPGPIEVFEWREEALETLNVGIRKAKLGSRVTVTKIDLDAHVWPVAHYDGLWSVDDFAYVGFPPHLATQVFKCLKPGACAVVEAYVGLPSPELSTAFASSFAEPQIRAHGDVLQTFADHALVLEADEDVTEEFLELARAGFKRLENALSEAAGFDALMARELAWEAEAWRTRLRLLAQRRLERRRLTLRRPADSAAPEAAPAQEPEKAPEPA